MKMLTFKQSKGYWLVVAYTRAAVTNSLSGDIIGLCSQGTQRANIS